MVARLPRILLAFLATGLILERVRPVQALLLLPRGAVGEFLIAASLALAAAAIGKNLRRKSQPADGKADDNAGHQETT